MCGLRQPAAAGRGPAQSSRSGCAHRVPPCQRRIALSESPSSGSFAAPTKAGAFTPCAEPRECLHLLWRPSVMALPIGRMLDATDTRDRDRDLSGIAWPGETRDAQRRSGETWWGRFRIGVTPCVMNHSVKPCVNEVPRQVHPAVWQWITRHRDFVARRVTAQKVNNCTRLDMRRAAPLACFIRKHWPHAWLDRRHLSRSG